MTIYQDRKSKYSFEKECLGIYGAHLLRERACYRPVAIDGGTTNLRLVQELLNDIRDSKPTVSQVITNHLEAINLAQQLSSGDTVWRCTGGVLRPERMTFIDGESEVRRLSFSIAVIGANGFRAPYLQTGTVREQPMKREMIHGAVEGVVFLVDCSKWGSPAGENLVTVDEVTVMNKQVWLLTCYPIRDAGESGAAFAVREERFLNEAREFVSVCRANVEGFAIKVTCTGDSRQVSESECLLSNTPDRLIDDLRAAYVKKVPVGQGGGVGVIIGFRCSRPS
jgi:hypothetical protein